MMGDWGEGRQEIFGFLRIKNILSYSWSWRYRYYTKVLMRYFISYCESVLQ